MGLYSLYTYCSQKESLHFGLRVSTDFALDITTRFGIENHKEKIRNIHKDFSN